MSDFIASTFFGKIVSNSPIKVRKSLPDGKEDLWELEQGTNCFFINNTVVPSLPKQVALAKDSNKDGRIDSKELKESAQEIAALLKKNGVVLASKLLQMGYLPLVTVNDNEYCLEDSKPPKDLNVSKEEKDFIFWGDPNGNANVTALKNISLSDGKIVANCVTKEMPDSKYKSLYEYGRDLTLLAKSGKLDPIIGRASEIQQTVEILSCRVKNNPVLIGDPGVGKTAVVEGLAQRIAKGDVPLSLKGKKVFALELTRMLAGASARGEFEKRLQCVLDEVKGSGGEVILFIDELHQIIGAGSSGSMDAANIMKPSLARGELHCIGATTINEYRKYIEKDSALERRFRPVLLNEPSVPDAIDILKGIKGKFESFHNVKYTDEAIKHCVTLTKRFVTDRFLPDKAIDVLDQAGASKKIEADLSRKSEPEKAEKVGKSETKWFSLSKTDKADEKPQALPLPAEVTEDDVANIVSKWTGVPSTKLTEEESKKLINLEDELHKRVIGQDEAVSVIAKAVRRSRAGLKDPKRPAGVFIFAGPTGVGKTETAKATAELLFGDEKSFIRMDMSEYMEGHNVSRLIGSPPGYVAYDEGGQLTEAVRKHPYSLILLDEIEKAHPQIFNVLLQVFDDGRLTDGQGRTVDFKNTIIVMTSNLGTQSPADGDTPKARHSNMSKNVKDAFKRSFRPEFLNRVDDLLVFQELKKDDVKKIFDLQIDGENKRLKDKNCVLEVTSAAKEKLVDLGFDPAMGARPLARVIQKYIEDPLSEKVIKGDVKDGGAVVVDVNSKNEIVLKNKKG